MFIVTEYAALKGPRCWISLLDHSNQGGWGMSVSLKGCKFEHTELWIHLESFNDECAIVKETQDEICWIRNQN